MDQQLTPYRFRSCHLPWAFSLVELLVVIAIIAIIVAIGTSAFSDVLRHSKLSSAGNLLQSEISFARQQAVTFNQEVEVRFFQTTRNGLTQWNGMQVVTTDSSGTNQSLRRPTLLPEGIVMDKDQSTLLNQASAPISGTASFGVYGTCPFRAFRFRSGGNTQPELTSSNNTLMLRTSTSQTLHPANFISVVINPINGRVHTYQP